MIYVAIINFALGILTGLRLSVWALLPVTGAEIALAVLAGSRLAPISMTAIMVGIAFLQLGYVAAAFSSAISREKRGDMNAGRRGAVPVKF